jgi:carbonic anhydrase
MKIHQPAELIENADVALQMLKEGNERYLKGELIQKNSYSADREILDHEQDPFAVILTCSDSRVAPEIFFDQKLGDIFVIRNAGNVADTEALGSIEYAVEHLKTKLVVICGHTKCGAVTAACAGGEFSPNVKRIVDLLQPAVDQGGGVSSGADIDKVVHNNVRVMVEKIKADGIINHPDVKIVGACYNIHSGEVEWL